ncbi:MAG: hypothetical protein F6J93_14635 [Oscillatoria sp. SIO1A7]|nr:hypothetical protein [Oscillatoria sp. SIO1A7]
MVWKRRRQDNFIFHALSHGYPPGLVFDRYTVVIIITGAWEIGHKTRVWGVGCGVWGKREASVTFSAFPYTLPPHPTP